MLNQVAVLSDIHGCLPVLEAILAEPDVVAADQIVITGDHVAGPQPVEVLDRWPRWVTGRCWSAATPTGRCRSRRRPAARRDPGVAVGRRPSSIMINSTCWPGSPTR